MAAASPQGSSRRWSLVDLAAGVAVLAAIGGVVWSPKLSGAVAKATGAMVPVAVSVDVRGIPVVNPEGLIAAVRQEGRVEIVRGRQARPRLVEKLQVTIGVNDGYVERAVQAILRGARTGEVGDGKIFVTPLDECIRIRTGERGSTAI